MEHEPKIEVTIQILYEDAYCMCINKPAGLSVHGDGKANEFTLADWILEYHPTLAPVGEPLRVRIGGEEITVPKPGIVHRLDKDTSGVMVLAKTHEAYEFFKQQFQEREIQKVYLAFVYGWIKEDAMEITGSIGRDSSNIRRWTVSKNARGTLRDAVTNIRVLKRFGHSANGGEYDGKGSTEDGTFSIVEARPKTGRTHQIRVHMRSVNHPIVGDSLYAPKRPEGLGFTRQALHARELSLALPSGQTITVQAPFPEDFQKALEVANARAVC